MRNLTIVVIGLLASAAAPVVADAAHHHRRASHAASHGPLLLSGPQGTAPVRLAEPPVAISPTASPNGLYSLSPAGGGGCNTNVAVVQQSACVH